MFHQIPRGVQNGFFWPSPDCDTTLVCNTKGREILLSKSEIARQLAVTPRYSCLSKRHAGTFNSLRTNARTYWSSREFAANSQDNDAQTNRRFHRLHKSRYLTHQRRTKRDKSAPSQSRTQESPSRSVLSRTSTNPTLDALHTPTFHGRRSADKKDWRAHPQLQRRPKAFPRYSNLPKIHCVVVLGEGRGPKNANHAFSISLGVDQR